MALLRIMRDTIRNICSRTDTRILLYQNHSIHNSQSFHTKQRRDFTSGRQYAFKDKVEPQDPTYISSEFCDGIPLHNPPIFPSTDYNFFGDLSNSMFAILVLIYQLFNVYQPAWWLNAFEVHNTLENGMINTSVLRLTLIIILRRYIFWFCAGLVKIITIQTSCSFRTARISVLAGGILYILWILLEIYETTSLSLTILVTFPFIIYICLYYSQIMTYCNSLTTSYPSLGIHPLPEIVHRCLSSPTEIREECNLLIKDFNCRMKHVVFSTFANVYCCVLVPAISGPVSLWLNIFWIGFFSYIVCSASFFQLIVNFFPICYMDLCHQAALHLGIWGKISCHKPSRIYPAWNEELLWRWKSVARYDGYLYKGYGIVNAGIPDNYSHRMFYRLFARPGVLIYCFLTLSVSSTVVGMVGLFFETKWNNYSSIGFVLFFQIYSAYNIIRDLFITNTLYLNEASESIQEKVNRLKKTK